MGGVELSKGVKQILWERGLWKDGMKAKLGSEDKDYPELSANDVLANCQDVKEHVLVMSGPVSRPHEGHYVMLAILEPYCLLACLLGTYVSDRPQAHHLNALCPFVR